MLGSVLLSYVLVDEIGLWKPHFETPCTEKPTATHFHKRASRTQNRMDGKDDGKSGVSTLLFSYIEDLTFYVPFNAS